MKKTDLNRRKFLQTASILGVTLLGSRLISAQTGGGDAPANPGEGKKPETAQNIPKPQVAVVESDDPAAATLAAVGLLGGIGKFVKNGQVVVIKPNIAWERPPELAATTNPEAVAALIKECYKAGAKKVKIVERSCQDGKTCFDICGFNKIIKDTGAERVILSDPKDYELTKFPLGKEITSWPISKEVLNCDVFINMPIAKAHGLSKLTLSIKNLMGIMGGRRSELHRKIGQTMPDTLSAVRPHLTIIDAYRVLVRNGPTGGNPKDVVKAKMIIASTDPVAADSYAAALPAFGFRGEDIPYVKTAYEMGLGEMDLNKMEILKKKI